MNNIIECVKCINTSANPAISFTNDGLCNVCQSYNQYFNLDALTSEKEFFLSWKNQINKNVKILVGLSGGKDSSATLYRIKELGLNCMAFTFNIGYYPSHIFDRARYIASQLNIPHKEIDIRKYIRDIDLQCYKKTAELYDFDDDDELKSKFMHLYLEGRKHYSIKCQHIFPFVRSCQLCRRTVIRAYYAEAIKHDTNIVVLGMNEWAGLSETVLKKYKTLSAIRKLQPSNDSKAVYVVHLPFLLQQNINETRSILQLIGWKKPDDESLIESNSNSCLFGKAAELKATNLLGFHPDSSRLAREVTAGFLQKKDAQEAISKKNVFKKTVKEVLQDASIL